MDKNKVKCPFCGHEQKIQYTPDAKCRGVFIRCQGRHCKKEFEMKKEKIKECIIFALLFLIYIWCCCNS